MPAAGGSKEPSGLGWTVDTLHSHLDQKFDTLQRYIDNAFSEADKRYGQRFEAQQTGVQAALVAQEKAVQAALTASDRAIEKAEANSEKWRANANEWRAAMSDREANFMPRLQAEQAFKSMEDKMAVLSKSFDDYKSRGEGRAGGMNSLWVLIAGAVGLGAAILSLLLRH